jgi:S-DNA-T family DNA segregation ATPase FtsK/SpoIIIE
LGSELSKCAAPLRTLPEQVEHSSLPASVTSGADLLLPLGLAFTSLQPVALPIATGEHVLVIGPSRSGRTTALRTIAATWQQSHPSGRVVSIAARRTGAREGTVVCDASELHDVLNALGHRDELLIVVDDAEMVDDPAGNLARLVASRREGVTVVAAGRPDALRSAYGHWTTAVRRSRLGLVMAACTDLDGDLLNVVLPRRLPIPARPGLAWLIADGDKQLIQVAVPPSASPNRSVLSRDCRAIHITSPLDAVGAAP